MLCSVVENEMFGREAHLNFFQKEPPNQLFPQKLKMYWMGFKARFWVTIKSNAQSRDLGFDGRCCLYLNSFGILDRVRQLHLAGKEKNVSTYAFIIQCAMSKL